MNEFPLHQLANIDVQYEDNHVIVAVKPPNMLSQADKTGDTDILTQLKEYIKIKYNKPGAVYLGLVHRLDRPVGGLMVFARTSKAASRLSAQMREHEMGREYLCVVEGRVKDRFTCIDYLKRTSTSTRSKSATRTRRARSWRCCPASALRAKRHGAVCHPPANGAESPNPRADGEHGRAAVGRQ